MSERNGKLSDSSKLVRDLQPQLDMHKPIESNGIHSSVLKELADVIMRLLAIIFQWSWKSEEVLFDWKKSSQFSRKEGRSL